MKPRYIVSDTTYLISRRTAGRRFLLRPSKRVNNTFRYCLAYASEKTDVEIHSYCVMSNHYHLICTDRRGNLPEFTGRFHQLVARCLNSSYGNWESFWAPNQQTSQVALLDDGAVLDKSSYSLANPVEAGLVSHGKKWPGERLWQPGHYQALRPDWFFSDSMPKKLKLAVTPLPIEAENPTKLLTRTTAEREARIRAEFTATSRVFLGAREVKRQSIDDSPNTHAPRRRLSPRLACKDAEKRAVALSRLEAFAAAYKDALASWRDGIRNVLFPMGTYRMARLHQVRIAES